LSFQGIGDYLDDSSEGVVGAKQLRFDEGVS